MKMERLTIKGGLGCWCIQNERKELVYAPNRDVQFAFNRLAKLEDKLESGEILIPPCKVGDMVYAILEVNDSYEIFNYTVKEIIIGENGFYFETPTSYSHKLKFGKRVFTDKSQAEARLKELQEQL